MNNNRDYIRAIDTYIKERFNVHSLFYQCEISYRHISGYKSSFSCITLMGGMVALLPGIVLIISNFQIIVTFFRDILLLVIIGLEIIIILMIIVKNFVIYKITGKSKHYDECLSLLRKSYNKSAGMEKTVPQQLQIFVEK